MLSVTRFVESKDGAPIARLVLDYDSRQKSRFLARLEDGRDVAVRLPRGTVLSDRDHLLTDDGVTIEVVAADEELSVARTSDSLLLARAAYHLGNRHVPLEIRAGRLAYRHDHVLDDMVRRLGLSLEFERVTFAPEQGAYGHGTASHSHDHHEQHDHHHHAHHVHGHHAGGSGESGRNR